MATSPREEAQQAPLLLDGEAVARLAVDNDTTPGDIARGANSFLKESGLVPDNYKLVLTFWSESKGLGREEKREMEYILFLPPDLQRVSGPTLEQLLERGGFREGANFEVEVRR